MARILVVDDSEDLRGLYAFLLLGEGHELMLATEGVDAVNKLLRCDFDVVLLDYALPGMTGLEVLRQIMCLRIESPPAVIMVSGYDDPDLMEKAIELGASAYLLKGEASTEELLALIASARDARRNPQVLGNSGVFQTVSQESA